MSTPGSHHFFPVKSVLLSGMLLLLGISPAYGQQNIERSRPLSTNEHVDLSTRQTGSGTLNIVAVRVAFQPDSNRLTSGNGTFQPGSLPYLENNEVSIDPLPHNRSYFEAHLEFAKNYFERVSGGALSVDYRVLDDVYHLEQKMEFYAPTGERFTNEKLALLARDTWQAVETAGGFNTTGLNPQNTAFVIFHAGVGRDIQLTGTSLDITPQDIPSLYLSTESLAGLLEDPAFEGFPVNNGTFNVSNSLILPRTLSRRGVDVTETEFVLQLSTNGLICATLGSHLGLPDLFNTRTGASGIGRFGLMDGAAIFSYNGLFPPEPSAWEKTYLGWISPFNIDLDSPSPISLTATSLRSPSRSAARHALSSREYFLVENRHRDPARDGATLTIRQPDGSELQTSFDNYDEAFVNQESGFEEELPPGVLVDIDNFDWSLPGGLDRGADGEPGTSDDRLLNGGVLIWHIDEAVIEQQIAENGVNANTRRQGVDLEEADGAQDIGRPVEGQNTNFSNGTAFDFWWADNDASVITALGDTLSLYENRFGPDTRPNNNSNSGAASFFEFYNFSSPGSVATFHARRTGRETVQPVSLPEENLPEGQTYTSGSDYHWKSYPLSISGYASREDSFLVIPSRSTTYALQLNEPAATLFDFQTGPPQQAYVGSTLVLADKPEQDDITIAAWSWDGNQWQNRWRNTGVPNQGFLSSDSDHILYLDFTDHRYNMSDGTRLTDLEAPQQRASKLGGGYSFLSQNELRIEGSSFRLSLPSGSARLYTGALKLTSDRSLFYLAEDDFFYLIDPEAENPRQLLFKSPNYGWPAMADFDDDNRLDFLFVNHEQNRLDALNANGAFLGGFPLTPPQGAQFTGTPLITDLDGDQSLEVIAVVQDSVSMNLAAYNQQGEMIPGFPLYVGPAVQAGHQPVHPVIFGTRLYAVSHRGDLKAWALPRLQDTRWGSRYGNEPYNKVTGRISGSAPPEATSSILVRSETYNWPNPARDETHIRYQTSGPGEVKIKIITVSGRIIFDQRFDVRGGSPEEQRISTAGWGSGIYLARVTANVNGKKASKLVKIAVVH
ncbi:T9SS type A sorting domain-containing protein [Halalkalibaculum sp. DA3122]|uniref:T9SS-dependent M6-like inactivated metalloprotease n=1 Tax=Halalkalibaculum sp. DA3122 TaxID=3373607 RepID=UPI0037546908